MLVMRDKPKKLRARVQISSKVDVRLTRVRNVVENEEKAASPMASLRFDRQRATCRILYFLV